MSKFVAVLFPAGYGAAWIAASYFFGYPGFIVLALTAMAITAVSIVIATAG